MFQLTPSPQSSVIRLFCVPNAGSGPTVFRGWRERFSPEVEAIVIQLPGREARFHDPPYRRIEPLVKDLAQAVIPWLAENQPFAFFGNSLGGLIAYETLLEIRRRSGREALHLFVSATGAPHCEAPLPPIGHLDDRGLVRAVNERYGRIPAPILADEEFLEAVLPTLRADICLLEAYRRRDPEPVSCPITAFAGTCDITVPKEHVEAWREQTLGSFERVLLDESHFYLQSAREILTRRVRDTLLAPARVC
jgi:medium-chain acyl-[acyl-carrier-protein] hydrolase